MYDDEKKEVNVEIDIEAFEGASARFLRQDPSSWNLCFSASLVSLKNQTSSLKQSVACVRLEGGSIAPMELPQSAGIVGVLENWRLDAWLQQEEGGPRIASTYSRWRIMLLNDRLAAPSKISSNPSKSWWSMPKRPMLPQTSTSTHHTVDKKSNSDNNVEGYRITGGALFAKLQVGGHLPQLSPHLFILFRLLSFF
jgi:hypothetical protein